MRAWKLQECVAHSPGSVTCLSLGRRSARVLATGGEDRRVKLWAVGKPACILSLTGHSSSVEATEFSQGEDRVAAGSLSGSIRIWDLEEVKIVRALSGHTSNVTTIDFHPFGNFIASGSLDTLVKLWDVSRKGCINTYRGHSGGVNIMRFSPDGKWIVSGGEDGVVKLWDLSAGRQLAELVGHSGPITSLAFHPTVLLLATASLDRTVRLFDLESLTQVAVSGSELAASPVRRLAFHPDGVCLYVATLDYLKVYEYESMSCIDTVPVGWRASGGLDDMAIAPSFNQLVGVSISNSLVSTYVVDIKSCAPFNDSSATSPESNVNPVYGSAQETTHLPNTVDSDVCQQPSRSNVQSGVRLETSRPPTRCGSSRMHPPMQGAKNRKSFCLTADENRNSVPQEDPSEPDARTPYNPSLEDQNELNTAADINDPDEYDRIFKPKRTACRSPPRKVTSNIASNSRSVPTGDNISRQDSFTSRSRPVCPTSRVAPESHHSPPIIPCSVVQPNPDHVRPTDASAAACNSVESLLPALAPPGPVRLDPLVPKPKINHSDATATNSSAELSESEWLIRVRRPHDPFMRAITARVKGLSSVRVMWTRDNARTAVEAALMMDEPAILVDVLGVLSQNCKLWNLDLVAVLLPRLQELIKSQHLTHVEVTCQAVCVILKNFAQTMRQVVDGPYAPGVDLMREERQRKCEDCICQLSVIRETLETHDVASRAGQYGKELVALYQLLV